MAKICIQYISKWSSFAPLHKHQHKHEWTHAQVPLTLQTIGTKFSIIILFNSWTIKNT